MTRWTGIVVARSGAVVVEMASRLPSFLHPLAGRPLIWHAAASLANLDPAPERVIVVGGSNLSADLFADIAGVEITLLQHEHLGDSDASSFGSGSAAVVVVDAAALVPPESILALLESPRGSWVGTGGAVAAARLDPQLVPEVLRVPTPLQQTRGVLTESGRLTQVEPGIIVRDRVRLAEAAERVRARLINGHMESGVTFLLPGSVLVDVDVRIGQDTVVYPGVVLEGQTTIGAETVIGPGCRIIDSWIGSGVELKGWNYVSHTSVRNRAILEPYVRRGFD